MIKLNYEEEMPDHEKLYRCDSDRILLTPGMIARGVCGGHHMRAAKYITLWEWVGLKIGFIR